MDRTSTIPGPPAPSLSPRLRAVAALVPPESRVVDVGTGHGLLPTWLLSTGAARTCIGTERSSDERARLRVPAGASGFAVRFGDGLRALDNDDEANVLVMSGFGARSMLRILSDTPRALNRFDRLLLQPQTERAVVRRWLYETGFVIVDEALEVDRGRYYFVIAAEPRTPPVHPVHPTLGFDDLMEVGPRLVVSGDPRVRGYWQQTLRRVEFILEGLPDGTVVSRVGPTAALARRVLAALPPERPRASR